MNKNDIQADELQYYDGFLDIIIKAIDDGEIEIGGTRPDGTVNKSISNELTKRLSARTAKAVELAVMDARIAQLNKLIDFNGATFNRWTQKDIANFFDSVGREYRALQAQRQQLGEGK